MATGVAQLFTSIFRVDPETMMKQLMEGAMGAMNMKPDDIKKTVDTFQETMASIDKRLAAIESKLDGGEHGGNDAQSRSEANGAGNARDGFGTS